MISNKVQYTYIHFSYEHEIGGISHLIVFEQRSYLSSLPPTQGDL